MPSEKLYNGPVAFIEGVHYPVGKDDMPDMKRPLRAVEGGGFRDAEKDEPLHNDVHHVNVLDLEVGGE